MGAHSAPATAKKINIAMSVDDPLANIPPEYKEKAVEWMAKREIPFPPVSDGVQKGKVMLVDSKQGFGYIHTVAEHGLVAESADVDDDGMDYWVETEPGARS